MARSRTLVVVLAGGAGGRLEHLTQHRAKPAVSYAGTHRLIDFPLSNAHNAGVDDVWVSQQFNPYSIQDHLANGRPWDMDRTSGGLVVLHPRQGHDDRTGFQSGTADGLWRFAPLIREFDPDALVVVSADAVYALDYAALVDEHREAGADVTLTTTEVDPEDAGRYGVVQAQGGRVTDYVYKPDEPEGALVSNEVFVFSPGRTLDLLDELAGSAGEEGLQDLGNELLPRLVDAGAAHEHRFGGYWRDVGTIDAYWSAHQELVDGETETLDLDDQAWPILTRGIDRRGAALVLPGAEVEASLLAAGTRIAGTVERSVIGRGGTVEEGATVRGAVVLPGATVRAGARVEHAIIDEGVEVGRDAVVGEHGGAIALVGLRAKVEEGARLPAGARMPELDR